ncbi:MAG TPA: helix-turn-helix domain-containing protein [Candidatus Kapabacteria bacterium]|nr:helix-turn-helix domain-containing protein [Candidatus Kapabacteria bacterium]
MASADILRTFGEKLRAARTEQQRSVADIASAIKINRRHLEAIEAGDLSQLPQGPYVAAFVREYARALGLSVPSEYAPVHAPPAPSPRDPKVVSHPAHPSEEGGLSQMARDTARFANTAVKGAVKTVTKTTESVVNLVETGGKEAFEVLTSRELWEEAEDIRRERQGLPPLEHPPEPPTQKKARVVQPPEALPLTDSTIEPGSARDHASAPSLVRAEPPARTSRRTTNMVIVLLALLFAGVAYFAIRMSRTQGGHAAIPGKDYVPAPLEKQQPIAARKPATATSAPAMASIAPPVKDSLRFQLRATQPVWVSIAPDGIPAYRGQMSAGEVRTFRAAQKFVVDIGNQKSVTMTLDGTPLSGLPATQNSNVVVRNLVLMRDRVTLGGNPVDFHKLTSPSPVAAKPAPAPKVSSGVPPPVIATRLEDLAKKAKQAAAQKARQAGANGHSNQTTHTSTTNSGTKHGKKSGKGVTFPTEPIHPVQPVPPTP